MRIWAQSTAACSDNHPPSVLCSMRAHAACRPASRSGLQTTCSSCCHRPAAASMLACGKTPPANPETQQQQQGQDMQQSSTQTTSCRSCCSGRRGRSWRCCSICPASSSWWLAAHTCIGKSPQGFSTGVVSTTGLNMPAASAGRSGRLVTQQQHCRS